MSTKTSTTSTTTCDRCGTVLDRRRDAYPPWAEFRYERPAGYDFHGCYWATDKRSYDLCNKCADAFDAWMMEGKKP